jgi:hypothetical protein
MGHNTSIFVPLTLGTKGKSLAYVSTNIDDAGERERPADLDQFRSFGASISKTSDVSRVSTREDVEAHHHLITVPA